MRLSTNLHYVKMGAQRITDSVERFISEAQSADAIRAERAANPVQYPAQAARPQAQPVFANRKVAEAT